METSIIQASSRSIAETECDRRKVYSILRIPDFLEDHSLLGDDPLQRLVLHCERWASFIAGLWVNPEKRDVSYWIRYRYLPDEGKVKSAFMTRSSETDDGFSNDLLMSLKSFGFEAEEASSDDKKMWRDLSSYSTVRVIRQREEAPKPLTRVFNSENQYLVSPWRGPGGVFDRLFEAFFARRKPVEVAICLKPDLLKPNERRFLEKYVAKSTTAAGHKAGVNLSGSDNQDNFTDPIAQRLGEISFDNLNRLGESFLTSVFVLAGDDATASGIARAISSQIDEEKPFGSDDKRSYADVIRIPKDVVARFIDDYNSLNFFFSPSRIPKIAERLSVEAGFDLGDFLTKRYRFMTDAKGAATAFRFPVGVKSGVKGLDVRQRAPDFIPYDRKPDLGTPEKNRNAAKENRQILLGAFESGGFAAINVNDFRRHALITGFTGSGKTQTALNLLHQFWNNFGIPFLVFESAKQEYRGFLGVVDWKEREKLSIYTLGNSTVAPFFLNPFEIQEGVRVETHISRLTTCFEAALPQLPFLPSIMIEALESVYLRFGLALTDVGPGDAANLVFPTLADLVKEVEKVIKGRGYVGENSGNIRAAILGRLKMLQFGSVGHMLNCRKSSPLGKIFTQPTILEMNDLNEQDKTLTTMFVLVFLREYREKHPDYKNLAHVTMVEEAHNILEETPSRANAESGSDSKAKAVASFCNMLTELRSVGEGLLIADQSPNKLARDAMRNTNVQIAHQLRDANDRETVANAMIMTQEQRDFIGKLRPGRAALFYSGLERATFIQADLYYSTDDPAAELPGKGFFVDLPADEFDEKIREHMTQNNVVERFNPETVLLWRECKWCPDKGAKCAGRFLAIKTVEEFAKEGDQNLVQKLCQLCDGVAEVWKNDPALDDKEKDKAHEEFNKRLRRSRKALINDVIELWNKIPQDCQDRISRWCFLRCVVSKFSDQPLESDRKWENLLILLKKQLVP